MIGDQLTGTLPDVQLTAVSHRTLQATYQGRPVRLAVIDDDGRILVAGDEVAKEVEATVINCYRNTLRGQGYLRVHSRPIPAVAKAA